MIQFILAGLVLGSIYALSAVGVIVTYVSAGVLNFAFAATAFFVARMYYFLHVQHHWPIATAAVLSIVVAGPAFGLLAWAVLFRFLRLSSQLIKVVSTIGLSVAIPPITVLLFGNETIQSAPGLAPEPVRVFHVFGVAVTLDQIIVYGCLLATVIIGGLVLRFTTPQSTNGITSRQRAQAVGDYDHRHCPLQCIDGFAAGQVRLVDGLLEPRAVIFGRSPAWLGRARSEAVAVLKPSPF